MKTTMCRYDFLLLITLSLALFATVFNSYHLAPGFDLYHNLIVAAIVAIGLFGCFLFRLEEVRVPYSILTWILLLVLIIIQPFISTIIHPDYLIFPIGTLALTVIFSIALANIKDKTVFLNHYLFIFIVFMLLNVVIQFLQLRGYSAVYHDFVIFPNASRIDGNFTQPNQAAFMLVLAGSSGLYFYTLYKNKIWLLCCALFVIGMAFTTSRGGLILGLASLILFNAFYNQSLGHKIKNSIIQLSAFTAVYLIGVFILKTFKVSSNVSDSAIERFSEGSLGARVSLQEQAWLMFQDNPLTGYGWGGFSKGSIDYATELSSFFFSHHSHFFVSQIASELGIIGLLCLVPITIFVIKKVSFKMDAFNAMCFTAISIVILYSCSEFPLWNVRFLIVFAVFVTLIDTKFLHANSNYSKILAVIALSLSVITIFYITSYLRIHSTIRYLAATELKDNEVEEVYKNIPNILGMTVFKENILFHYISIDSDALEGKLSIAERTTATELTKRNLFRYGQLLALNNEPEKSVGMFKAACVLNWNGNCDNIIEELNNITEEEPKIYGEINTQVEAWVVSFDPKSLN